MFLCPGEMSWSCPETLEVEFHNLRCGANVMSKAVRPAFWTNVQLEAVQLTLAGATFSLEVKAFCCAVAAAN